MNQFDSKTSSANVRVYMLESAGALRSSPHCSVVCLNECLSSVLQYRRDMTLAHSLMHSLVSTVCAL